MNCPNDKTSKENLIKSVSHYLTEVLEKPRDEYEGLPACPFIKKERLKNTLLIDVFDNRNESFLDKIKDFHASNYTDAVFAQVIHEKLSTTDSKIYQDFLNKLLKENYNQYRVIITNPNDDFHVNGFNPRSLAPCFLIVVTDHKKLAKAHKQMLNSKYFTNFNEEYLKFLHVKKEQLNLK